MSDDLGVVMEIPPDIAFSRLLTTAAEAMALRGGVGQRESLRFQLVVEEFFACLCELAADAKPVRLVLTAKRCLLRAAFSFSAARLSLGALNVATKAPANPEEEPVRDLSLLLAGKTADRFQLELQGENRFLLEAEVDKAYPPAPAAPAPQGLRPPFTVGPCRESAPLSQAAALALASYPAWQRPPSFRTPGKFADLVEDGQIQCVLARDATGRPAGLLGWNARGDQALVFSGPFVFSREEAPRIARRLVDAFLETVARDRYSIVLGFQATDDLPADSFEPLGALDLRRDGHDSRQPVLFRHLREDAGLAVWSSPRLEDFLRQAYDRLAMPRDLLPVESPTGRGRAESLLGCALDRDGNLAELRPFLDGEDMAENLAAHVRALRDKGIDNILFNMDLSRSWEAALADDLSRAGFAPQVVLPRGGRGDVVVWRHGRTD